MTTVIVEGKMSQLKRIAGNLGVGESRSWTLDFITKVTRLSTCLYEVSVKAPSMDNPAVWVCDELSAGEKLAAWIR